MSTSSPGLLFLSLPLALSALGKEVRAGGTQPQEVWASQVEDMLPRFEYSSPRMWVRLGDTALLPCIVANLGDRSVTWMRQRDLHILTAGALTYSADERFSVSHQEGSRYWTLRILLATRRDSGVYECHVNSDPKISRRVTLTVLDPRQLDDPTNMDWTTYSTTTMDPIPRVEIEGGEKRHIQAGSVLTINCLIQHPPQQAPNHVLWFHGSQKIDYDSPRGGISLQVEKLPRRTRSQVTVSKVRESDSGEYTCSPSNLLPAVITVHVEHGQQQAAVQQRGQSNVLPSCRPTTLLLILLVLPRVWPWT